MSDAFNFLSTWGIEGKKVSSKRLARDRTSETEFTLCLKGR